MNEKRTIVFILRGLINSGLVNPKHVCVRVDFGDAWMQELSTHKNYFDYLDYEVLGIESTGNTNQICVRLKGKNYDEEAASNRTKTMTIFDLKVAIKDLPDNMKVFIPLYENFEEDEILQWLISLTLCMLNKMIGSSFNTEEYVNVRYRATTVDDVLRDIYKKYNTDNILSGYKFYTVLMLEGHLWKCPLQQFINRMIGEPELDSIQKKFVSDFADNLFKELVIDSFKIYTNTELKSKCLYIYINFDKNKVAINKTIKTIRDMICRTSETEEDK